MTGRSYRRDATRNFAEGVRDRMQSMEALQLQLFWLLQSVVHQVHDTTRAVHMQDSTIKEAKLLKQQEKQEDDHQGKGKGKGEGKGKD